MYLHLPAPSFLSLMVGYSMAFGLGGNQFWWYGLGDLNLSSEVIKEEIVGL